MTTTSLSSTIPTPLIASIDADALSHEACHVYGTAESFVGRFSLGEEASRDVMDSHPHYQDDDDVRVLLGAIQLLANLAAMEARAYESSLWHRPSEDPPSHRPQDNDEASTSNEPGQGQASGCPLTILKSIDALQRAYDFDSHTSIPQLVRSVHRLQSNRLCLQQELGQRESHLNELQIQLLHWQQQKDNLHNENSDLRSQLSKARNDKRILKAAVRRYQAANESQRKRIQLLEQVNQVLRVRVHERQLHANRPSMSSDDASVIVTPAPSCPESNDARVKRKGRQCEEDGTDATDASTVTPTSPMRTFAMDEDDDDTNSLPSFIHTIVDDGIATIRFSSPADAYNTLESFNGSSLSSLDDLPHHGNTVSPCASPIPWPSQSSIVGRCQPFALYTLTYAMGSKMGLRVRPVELESAYDNKVSSPTLPSRKPLIPTESLMLHHPTPSPSMDVKSIEDPSSSIHLGSLLGKKPRAVTPTSRPRQAFLVCGYTDAESSAPTSFRPVKKPPVGARIVAVNGQPVGDHWTFAQFLDRMKHADGSRAAVNAANGSSAGEESLSYYTVTFRNDRLTERQREQLAAPNRGTSSAESNTAPALFDRGDRAAETSFQVLPNADSVPGTVASSLSALHGEPNLQNQALEPNSTVLRSISSSFWSKAAEMYASQEKGRL